MNGRLQWVAGLLLVLGLAGSPAQVLAQSAEERLGNVEERLGNVEERLDGVEGGMVQLEAQITVLAGKIDALTWVLIAGFGFLGLVILFRREQPAQPQAPADQRALDEVVEQAVRRVLAQQEYLTQRGAGGTEQ